MYGCGETHPRGHFIFVCNIYGHHLHRPPCLLVEVVDLMMKEEDGQVNIRTQTTRNSFCFIFKSVFEIQIDKHTAGLWPEPYSRASTCSPHEAAERRRVALWFGRLTRQGRSNGNAFTLHYGKCRMQHLFRISPLLLLQFTYRVFKRRIQVLTVCKM